MEKWTEITEYTWATVTGQYESSVICGKHAWATSSKSQKSVLCHVQGADWQKGQLEHKRIKSRKKQGKHLIFRKRWWEAQTVASVESFLINLFGFTTKTFFVYYDFCLLVYQRQNKGATLWTWVANVTVFSHIFDTNSLWRYTAVTCGCESATYLPRHYHGWYFYVWVIAQCYCVVRSGLSPKSGAPLCSNINSSNSTKQPPDAFYI